MKILLLASFLFASIIVQAQNKLPKRQLQVGAGISTYNYKGYSLYGQSFHGSYTEYVTPKFPRRQQSEEPCTIMRQTFFTETR